MSPGAEGPFTSLRQYAVHHDRTSVRLYHPSSSPLVYHFMVASVFLHMCRVYFTGAYRNPRELNWLIGVALMATYHRLWILRLPLALGLTCIRATVIGINNWRTRVLLLENTLQLCYSVVHLSLTNRDSDVLHSRVYPTRHCHNADCHSLVYCLGTRYCRTALIKRRKKKWD